MTEAEALAELKSFPVNCLDFREQMALDMAIEAMEKQEVAKEYGWIPCNERLPSKEEFFQNDGRFIVTDGNRVYQSTYDIYGQCFRTMKMHVLIDMGYRSSFEVDNCVIEWMPLPIAPYQKGE